MNSKQELYEHYKSVRKRIYGAGHLYLAKHEKTAVAPASTPAKHMSAREVILTLKDADDPVQTTMDALLRSVCRATKLSHKEMISHRRFDRLIHARYVFMYLADIHTKQSRGQISGFVGGLHRTVVGYAIIQINENRHEYQHLIDTVRADLGLNTKE
jgi:chromosomal replication initiation ATPase DnaA